MGGWNFGPLKLEAGPKQTDRGPYARTSMAGPSAARRAMRARRVP